MLKAGVKASPNCDVLFLTASVGGGHLNAVRAMEISLLKTDPCLVVQTLDHAQLVNSLGTSITKAAYLRLLKVAPFLWGYVYKAIDRIPPDSFVQHRINHVGYRGLTRCNRVHLPQLFRCCLGT